MLICNLVRKVVVNYCCLNSALGLCVTTACRHILPAFRNIFYDAQQFNLYKIYTLLWKTVYITNNFYV